MHRYPIDIFIAADENAAKRGWWDHVSTALGPSSFNQGVKYHKNKGQIVAYRECGSHRIIKL